MTTSKTKKTATRKTANGKTNKPNVKALAIIKAVDNPRQAGTAAAKRYASMLKYIKSNRNKPLSEVFAATEYGLGDFRWDLAHKYIEVRKVS